MKKNILLAFIFGIVSLSVSAQCTFTLTNTSNDTTYIITSNTALSCINNPGLRSYLICPGVTVTYQDNSCSQKFYLEPGATLIYDTTFSYGYSYVYAKAGSTVDFNGKQVMKVHHENGTNLIDQGMMFMGDSLCNGAMSFDYSNLPNGTGCGPTGLNEISTNNIMLYPNPAGEMINVNIDSYNDNSFYFIYDHMGRAVRTGKVESTTTPIPTGSLASGFYILKVNNSILKFVKE